MEDAKIRLVTYYKAIISYVIHFVIFINLYFHIAHFLLQEGTPLQSILDTWKGDVKQPNLLCLGSDKNSLDNFFIICDRLLLPLAARNSTEAIDSLFKSHYVFGTEYDVSLRGLWKFIQVYIFKLDPEEPNLPMKVKQVFNQLNRGINQPQKNV